MKYYTSLYIRGERLQLFLVNSLDSIIAKIPFSIKNNMVCFT